jgi:tetratricopeptide (TPR) repeat protein
VRRYYLPALALCILTAIAYGNSFGRGFPFDNAALILPDARLHAATSENVSLILDHTYWWPYQQSGLYRPVTSLSYLFNYAVLGNREDAVGYHCVNLILHLVNVLLVFALALYFTHSPWPSAFVAGLWAVHPVLTESVTNIVGRADLLSGMGILGGFWLYLQGAGARGGRRLAWLGGLFAASMLAVFSKESGVALLGVLCLYEALYWKEQRNRVNAALGLLAVLVPVLLLLYQRTVVAPSETMTIPFVDNPIVGAGFWTGRFTAVSVLGRYLWVILWPRHLFFDYSYPAIALFRATPQDCLAGLTAAAAASLAVVLLWKNRTCALFLMLAFVAILPAANLLFPIGTIMAERLLYLPCVGVIFGIVALAYRGLGRMAPYLLGVLLAALAVRTFARNADWKSNLTLSAAAVDAQSRSYKAHLLLAESLFSADQKHSRIAEAVAEADRSVSLIAPLSNADSPVEPYRAAALYHFIQGLARENGRPVSGPAGNPEAEADYRAALRFVDRAIALTEAGTDWAALRKRDLAGFYREANGMAFGTLCRLESSICVRLGDPAKAIAAALRAREFDPLAALTYRGIAEALESAGRNHEAAVALLEGVILTSDEYLKLSLGRLYQTSAESRNCVRPDGHGGIDLNMSCASIHRDACAAAAESLAVVTGAGRADLAGGIRNLADRNLGCGATP